MDASHDPTAAVRDAARSEMLERLTHFAPTPQTALVLGGGGDDDAAVLIDALRRRFPRARIVVSTGPDAAVRADRPLARAAAALRRRMPGLAPPVERLAAPADRLPLTDGSVGLALGHWLAPGAAALDAVLGGLRRVLVPGGLFLWTTPGLGAAADPLDMHDLGGALARAGFTEPVLDVDRHRSADGGVIEVVHAAAFAGAAPRNHDGETIVPIDRLGRRGRAGG